VSGEFAIVCLYDKEIRDAHESLNIQLVSEIKDAQFD
jgi:hypothetical protein